MTAVPVSRSSATILLMIRRLTGIQSRERFVEDDEFWRVLDRGAELDELTHTPAEFADLFVSMLGEFNAFEYGVDKVNRFVRGDALQLS